MSACSARCGYCGRCDDDPRPEAAPEPVGCDICGDPVRLTVAGVGAFCGPRCASRRVPELYPAPVAGVA